MVRFCGKHNGKCPEIARETCDGCELMETYLKFKQESLLLEVLKNNAKKEVRE